MDVLEYRPVLKIPVISVVVEQIARVIVALTVKVNALVAVILARLDVLDVKLLAKLSVLIHVLHHVVMDAKQPVQMVA